MTGQILSALDRAFYSGQRYFRGKPAASIVSARRGGFVAMIVAFVLSLSCLGLAFWQRADYAKEDSAIVTRAVTTVRSSPSDSTAKDLFVLHEGTKVTVIDELGSWLNIELSDGRQGWITASDLEII